MSAPINVAVKSEILETIRTQGVSVLEVSKRYGVGVSTIYGWLRANNGKAATYFCAVANVISERSYGHGAMQTKRGTKLFAPNAKVYVVEYFWGKGAENVTVIGHHRVNHKFITVVVKSEHLRNWRIQPVYSPTIIKEIASHDWNGVHHKREELQVIVDQFNASS